MSNLHVIRASAGSGKTYTLTNEYLKLLFSKERGYRNILAVTFTNKATEEMKRRVVESLHKESKKSPVAAKKLAELLHDYSSFSISTIDKFFQQTVRAFAREIGKNSAYGVELDTEMVLQEAIDNMIYNLDKEENQDLLNWLIVISNDRVEQGDGWNIRDDIKKLANELFKESYLGFKREIEDKVVAKREIAELSSEISVIIKEFTDALRKLSERAFCLIERENLQLVHFKGGSRTPLNFFKKVIDGKIENLSNSFRVMREGVDALVALTTKKKDPSIYESIQNCWHNGLGEVISQVCDLYDNQYVAYRSAIVVKNNLQIMGVIFDLERFISDYTKENNVVLIPETTQLLNSIIDESDAPFIYEKSGVRIDHFMLDEFQDTSLMQWKNFLPLINESLSRGMSNLIVGDEKQSIYRWRGSDWGLLSSGIYNDIPPNSIIQSALKQNWRSSKNIIDFNNALFPFAGEVCREFVLKEAGEIYKEAFQEYSSQTDKSKGYVWVKFLESTRPSSNDWQNEALIHSLVKSKEAIERGYRMSDISFLVRTNREARLVVNFLLENGLSVISDEALLIDSSPTVRKVLSLLQYMVDPHDAINNRIALFLGIDTDKILDLSHLPLYELCQKCALIVNPSINQSETLFVSSFLDIVLEQSKVGISEPSSFIRWWRECGFKISVPAPDGQEAIRVMTIHKSKGLGIPIVILPFLHLEMEHNAQLAPILWCKTKESPYNKFPLLPIKYSSSLMDSYFQQDYLLERSNSYIDNLNTAYVALTRAERELYIIAPQPSGSSGTLHFSKILYTFVERELNENEFCMGEPTAPQKELSKHSVEVKRLESFNSYDLGSRISLSLRGEEFYSDESMRARGMALHKIMEYIEVESDLDFAIERVVSLGLLQNSKKEELREELIRMLNSVKEFHWFDGSFKVIRELDLILPGGQIKRPDRVLMGGEAQVIDFKFGKKQERAHRLQMIEYLKLIKESGIAYVKGFIWYPNDNHIEKVLL